MVAEPNLEQDTRREARRGPSRARVALRLCALFLVSGALFPLALTTRLAYALGARRRAIAWSAAVQALWARASLAAAGIALEVEGEVPPGAHLVCANHQSYVDVLVLAAGLPGRFVAMREIAGWPLTLNDAVYGVKWPERRKSSSGFELHASSSPILTGRWPSAGVRITS